LKKPAQEEEFFTPLRRHPSGRENLKPLRKHPLKGMAPTSKSPGLAPLKGQIEEPLALRERGRGEGSCHEAPLKIK
jgi:hypothetical protein